MKLFKTYIEISNICNLQCTFCPEVEREKKVLRPNDFKTILKKVIPHTEFITLHLMGEPLAHPEFLQILKICEEENAKVHLTTNGTLLNKYSFSEILSKNSIKQINFSLHSFKDNFPTGDLNTYLYDILLFSRESLKERPDLYINYRLWNLEDKSTTQELNRDIIDKVSEFFQMSVNEKVDVGFKKSKNIIGRIYFHFDTRFEWPSLNNITLGTKGFCHAISQQIGVHADGTVVPCCLDKEANIKLGNLLDSELHQIFDTPRTRDMATGFKSHLLKEELCQKCTYIKRFDKKLSKTS